MSGFYDDASWVLIPEGIKEDVVYAQKPTNGTGDLSFTRASDATRTNSAGVIERTPWNLLQFSEMFSDAYWGKLSSSISSNVVSSPNGTLTADKLIPDTATTEHRIVRDIPLTNSVETISIYAKAAGYNFLGFRIGIAGSFRQLNFNLSNGTFTNHGGAGDYNNISITPVGDGWYRCSASFLRTNTLTQYHALSSDLAIPSYAGNGVDGIFIWGAQLVEGTDAKPYFATTNRQDVPRLDYRNADGSLNSCPRLLLEPQRTNLALNSQSFIPSWSTTPQTTALVLPTTTIDPEGLKNAVSIERVVGNTFGRIFSISTSVTYTNSIYVRRVSGTGNVELVGVNGTSINIGTDITSEWKRFSISETATSTTGRFYVRVISIGDVIEVWGAQLEAGAYPTTYIPTTTAAVTRLADAASKTGVSSLIGQTEGTLYCEFNIGANTFNGDLISVNSGSIANGFFVSFRSSAVVQLIVRTASTNALVFQRLGAYPIGNNKIAVGYKNGDFAISLNGTVAQVNTSIITMPTGLSVVDLSSQSLYASTIPMAQAQAALFPTRLTNAQLAEMTTL
jgi:hypothetical protein